MRRFLLAACFLLAALPLQAQTPKGNFVSGVGSTTGTGATTIITAPATTLRIYVTGVECGRNDAGTSAIFVTLNDTSSTVLILPNSGGGGGNNAAFTQVPLTVAHGTALTFTSSANTTTVYCSAQGYLAN